MGATGIDAPGTVPDARRRMDLLMQHLAKRADRPLPNWATGQYTKMLDVKCGRCGKVTYELWSPHLETEAETVEAQSEWLRKYVAEHCPHHPDSFLTPDRP